jgi:hypothetical protein
VEPAVPGDLPEPGAAADLKPGDMTPLGRGASIVALSTRALRSIAFLSHVGFDSTLNVFGAKGRLLRIDCHEFCL